MKVYIAGFDTVTNTFSPITTGYQPFVEGFMARGDATKQAPNYCSAQLHTWRRLAEARGWQVVEGLCTLAEPGGVCVSGAIHDQVRGKLPVQFEDLGTHDVKNITHPIHVFRVRPAAGSW